MTTRLLTLTALLSLAAVTHAWADDQATFVADGAAKAVYSQGASWQTVDGALTCGGCDNFLYATKGLGKGDFKVQARLTITNLAKSAASFVLDKENFGFEGASGKMFVGGRLLERGQFVDGDQVVVEDGKTFILDVVRQKKEVTISIDGKPVYCLEWPGVIERIGLRPWRSTMAVESFTATGNLVDAPKPVEPVARTQADGYTIPVLDISDQTDRQVVIARGTKDVYQGHPDTLLMPDGRTMFAAWTLNHGGACGPLKKSTDGGLTWSELLPVPENWKTIRNCPTLHRVVGPDGVERLIVMAGNGAMHQSISLDQGKTFTPMKPNGLHCVVVPMNLMPLAGDRLLAVYHRGHGDRDRPPLEIWQSISEDGGQTWLPETKVYGYPAGNPCEPWVVRSPNGKQLAILSRENARRYNSLLVISDDEAKTWSRPVELPAALTGDRHHGVYLPDGRLVICFRDTAYKSPTRGDFVAWVGTYDDIVNLREGQYRVRLMTSPKKFDLGYPGMELLPDGTVVATTYIQLKPDEKNSVVSVRFKIEELDTLLAKQQKSE